MAVYKLDWDDCVDDDFELLGIHTTLECYHLAYFINRELNVRFKKINAIKDFDFYEFDDEKNQCTWNLIANKGLQEKVATPIAQESLFQLEETAVTYLLPEYKKVDYLIKIAHNTHDIKNMIEKMKTIPQIITTFAIDISNLKSKNNLNFY